MTLSFDLFNSFLQNEFNSSKELWKLIQTDLFFRIYFSWIRLGMCVFFACSLWLIHPNFIYLSKLYQECIIILITIFSVLKILFFPLIVESLLFLTTEDHKLFIFSKNMFGKMSLYTFTRIRPLVWCFGVV